jgi:hypothetical protein
MGFSGQVNMALMLHGMAVLKSLLAGGPLIASEIQVLLGDEYAAATPRRGFHVADWRPNAWALKK